MNGFAEIEALAPPLHELVAPVAWRFGEKQSSSVVPRWMKQSVPVNELF